MDNDDLVILAQSLEKIGYVLTHMEQQGKNEVNFTIEKKPSK